MKNIFLKRCRKRTNFAKLFAKAMIPVVLITAVFSALLLWAVEFLIYRSAHEQFMDARANLRDAISGIDVSDQNADLIINSLEHNMSKLGYNIYARERYISDSYHSPNGVAFFVLFDEDGNIVVSSRERLWCLVKLDAEKKYIVSCDMDIPETEELYKELKKECGVENVTCNDIKSLYINTKELKMIPHEMNVAYYRQNGNRVSVKESKELTINTDMEGYELIEIKSNAWSSKNEPYPRASLIHFTGTDRELFESLLEKYKDKINMSAAYFSSENIDMFTSEDYSVDGVKMGDKKYCLISVFRIDGWTKPIRIQYFSVLALFFAAAAFIAALLCWKKNVFNRSMYAFEDYQRDLTNSLAHDLKTPLMAIGGYAENLLDGMLTDEEKTKYLNSIMNSVKYTDKIILDTLELNTLESRSGAKKEKFNLRELAEKSFEKYAPVLDENGIQLSFDGDCEVCADKTAVERIIENLVSNAVKYTEKGGSIKVAAGKKRISVTNTVGKKLDVSKIKQPFVKGDSSRSGMNGNGLGLAIADKTASHIGGKLSVSCSESEFTAELKL